MKKNNFLKKIFGKRFDIWDIFFLIIIIGFPIYLFKQQGVVVFIEDFGWAIYGAVVTGFIVKFFFKKQKK
jgi:hypothetical protein